MAIKRITVSSVDIADKPGSLHKFLSEAAAANVDFYCLAAFSAGGGKGRIYLSPKVDPVFQEFTKKAKIKTKTAAGFLISGSDKVGAAANALQKLAKAGINGLAGTAMVCDGQYHMLIVVDADDADAAEKALTA